MKKLVKTPVVVEKVIERVTEEKEEIQETGSDAYTPMLGKVVIVFCTSLIYTGTLSGVNGTVIALANPSVLYETGDFSSKNWKDAQKLPVAELVLERAQIESCGVVVK